MLHISKIINDIVKHIREIRESEEAKNVLAECAQKLTELERKQIAEQIENEGEG
jgi:hypothetical protein